MVKKLYSFSNAREIWRLIPAGENKILIEERNQKTKEVFFNCIYIDSGKKILKNYQLEDKFWVGVEAVNNDVIYFHRFLKPDLPNHKDIIAFDINKKKVKWESDLTFLTIYKDILFAYNPLFEGRDFFKLNIETGDVIKKLDKSPEENISEEFQNSNLKNFNFSNIYSNNLTLDDNIHKIILNIKENNVITGRIEFLDYKSILFMSFHVPTKTGKLNKMLFAVDILTGNVILKKIINSNIEVFIPDSFFLVGNYLFVLFETKKLNCYLIKKE